MTRFILRHIKVIAVLCAIADATVYLHFVVKYW
jgi:hypothetical protein